PSYVEFARRGARGAIAAREAAASDVPEAVRDRPPGSERLAAPALRVWRIVQSTAAIYEEGMSARRGGHRKRVALATRRRRGVKTTRSTTIGRGLAAQRTHSPRLRDVGERRNVARDAQRVHSSLRIHRIRRVRSEFALSFDASRAALRCGGS